MAFESSVYVVWKTHLTFLSSSNQSRVIAYKPLSPYIWKTLPSGWSLQKILDVWMTITHKGIGLESKLGCFDIFHRFKCFKGFLSKVNWQIQSTKIIINKKIYLFLLFNVSDGGFKFKVSF